MKNHPLKETVNNILSKNGYLRKSSTWYKEISDVVATINLQKSNYSDAYYLNIGIGLKRLANASTPDKMLPDLILRIEDLLTDDSKMKIVEALDLGNSQITDQVREQLLTNGFEEVVIPFLESHSTEVALVSLIRNDQRMRSRARKELAELAR